MIKLANKMKNIIFSIHSAKINKQLISILVETYIIYVCIY